MERRREKIGNHSIGTDSISAHGITLISLVVTIIILLILAGIVLSLTMGEYKDYLFEIDENYNVSVIKKLQGEQPHIEIQIMPQIEGKAVQIRIIASITNGSIESIQAINGAMLSSDISTSEKIFSVTKNGTYYFLAIANNGRKKVQSFDVEQILEPQVEVTTNNTTLTMNVKNIYEPENIKNFHYYIDDKLVESSDNSCYIIELEEDRTYKLKVLIEFKDGSKKFTQEVEKRIGKIIYLYQDGNKYNQITGGYTFRKIQTTDVTYTDSNYLYMYAHGKYGVGYGEIELYTNNAIDITEFDTINFDMDYNVVFGQDAWRTHFYYGLQNCKIIDVPGTNSSTGKVISMNIKNINGSYRPYFRILSCSANSDVWVKIRAIYLVKE